MYRTETIFASQIQKNTTIIHPYFRELWQVDDVVHTSTQVQVASNGDTFYRAIAMRGTVEVLTYNVPEETADERTRYEHGEMLAYIKRLLVVEKPELVVIDDWAAGYVDGLEDHAVQVSNQARDFLETLGL